MKNRNYLRKLCAAMMTLLCLLPMPGYAASITGAVSGTSGFNGSEGYESLVDANTSTKWCVKFDSSAYAIFQTDEAVKITGYTLITGNDTEKYPGRNPASWTLYGMKSSSAPSKSSSGWVRIHSVSNDRTMKSVNYTPFDFPLSSKSEAYNYFKLEITENHGDEAMQLSELQLRIDGQGDTIRAKAVSGTSGINSKEDYTSLFDTTADSKWCVKFNGSAYAIWEMTSPVSITGYTLVTANDNRSYTGRNPKSWTLYGSNASSVPSASSSSWKEIHRVSNDKTMKDENYEPYDFKLSSASKEYKYFMIKVTDNHGDSAMQLSELMLQFPENKLSISYPYGGGSSGSGGYVSSIGGSSSNSGTKTRCYKCHGDGRISCTNCDGRGYKTKYVSVPNYSGSSKTSEEVRENCFKCSGGGRISCTNCGGSGYN